MYPIKTKRVWYRVYTVTRYSLLFNPRVSWPELGMPAGWRPHPHPADPSSREPLIPPDSQYTFAYLHSPRKFSSLDTKQPGDPKVLPSDSWSAYSYLGWISGVWKPRACFHFYPIASRHGLSLAVKPLRLPGVAVHKLFAVHSCQSCTH